MPPVLSHSHLNMVIYQVCIGLHQSFYEEC